MGGRALGSWLAVLTLLLAGPALAIRPPSTGLLGALELGNAERLLREVVALGHVIDLADAAQVRAAIGPVDGARSRGALERGFVGYQNNGGEVVFNDRAERNRRVLLVSPRACVPLERLERLLAGPEFAAPVRKSTVVPYIDTEFRGRPGTAFTYPYGSRCVGSFGLSQDRKQA